MKMRKIDNFELIIFSVMIWFAIGNLFGENYFGFLFFSCFLIWMLIGAQTKINALERKIKQERLDEEIEKIIIQQYPSLVKRKK